MSHLFPAPGKCLAADFRGWKFGTNRTSGVVIQVTYDRSSIT